MNNLESLITLCVSNHTPEELARGWLRYECVRRMSPRQFQEICTRNLLGECALDDLIDAAVRELRQETSDSRLTPVL